LALLSLGLVGLPPTTAKSHPGWWAVLPRPLRPAEGEFAVLALPTGPVGAAAVDPADTRTIYLGGAEGLFRSQDWGETWSLLSRELRYPHILVVDPAERRCLYAARRDVHSFLPMPAVYRSDDGGCTWKRLVRGLGEERIFSLALDPFHWGTLYAGSWAGRVYKTVDRGEHWQPLPVGAMTPGLSSAPSTVGQLLVGPVDGAVYALQTYGGTSKSTDDGTSWERIHEDGSWLAVDAVRGDLYLAGRRLQRSGDGGHTWTDLSAGLPFNAGTGSYAAYWVAVNPEPLVLYTRYHRSTDGGSTWVPLETPATFIPRLLLPGARPAVYGSVNGQAARYREWDTDAHR
jgi:photosystem II stability/assembly factor-like uncharacterized protein